MNQPDMGAVPRRERAWDPGPVRKNVNFFLDNRGKSLYPPRFQSGRPCPSEGETFSPLTPLWLGNPGQGLQMTGK